MKKLILIGSVLLVAAIISSAQQSEIVDDLRSATGVIAFAITPADGNGEIFFINANGTGKTQLTNQPGRPYGPAFSPDATRIAFYNHISDQTWSLYLMNADGRHIQRLTNASNTLDWSPDWSPDGSRIVFARSFATPAWRSEIWLINPDGSNLHRLGNLDGQGPDWSADGSRIVYFNYVEGGGDIRIANANGTDPIKLTDNPAEDWWPKFSPDSGKIAFQTKRDGNFEIYVMNSDGTKPIRLTNNSADDEDPNWSPDGTKIAFISMRDGHYEVYTMNADGSNQTRITATNGHAIDPDWKPFGKAIHVCQEDFPILKGSYLGQKPPGITPEHFGVGIIDKDERVFAITFSPDGKECFYTKSLTTNTIMATKEVNGRWSGPEIAEFSGKVFDFEPHITPNGKKMIFGSKRSLPGMNKQDEIPQWVIEKKGDGWSDPKPLGPPFSDGFCMYVSVANNRNIYFTGKDGIYQSAFLNGKYSTPEKLGHVINDLQYAAHPFIAPDESYLIFDAQPEEGNAELFVSFRNEDESWSEPQRFDSRFNTALNELAAYVTCDGKYLFFSRLSPGKGDIYWVSAEIIENLKPKDLK